MWVLGSNIVIGVYVPGHVVSDVWFHMWVLASNIAIGVYVLEMWSVLCILYVVWWDLI